MLKEVVPEAVKYVPNRGGVVLSTTALLTAVRKRAAEEPTEASTPAKRLSHLDGQTLVRKLLNNGGTPLVKSRIEELKAQLKREEEEVRTLLSTLDAQLDSYAPGTRSERLHAAVAERAAADPPNANTAAQRLVQTLQSRLKNPPKRKGRVEKSAAPSTRQPSQRARKPTERARNAGTYSDSDCD